MAEYSDQERKKLKPVVTWLLIGCVLVLAMVVIGGLTRLTGSGLSMTDYRLVTGSFPPMNDADWLVEFNKYKESPQFKKINFSFSIQEFKQIYWWEYIHRLLGRLIGLVFIIPFVFFLVRKTIPKRLLPRLLTILVLGGFQGFLGWYMVKSGLVDRPSVSHFRLAAHLITAFLTFAVTYWTAMDLMVSKTIKPTGVYRNLNTIAVVCLVLLSIQIMYGAFVAGLKAGYVYNTWPKMGEEWIADAVGFGLNKNGIASLINDLAGIQFVHRYLAYIVVIAYFILWLKALNPEVRPLLQKNQLKAVNGTFYAVLLQFTLGVLTLILVMPTALAVLHQLGAMLLLTLTLWFIHSTRREDLSLTK